MGDQGFTIDPGIDPRWRRGLEWLLDDGHVLPQKIDGSGTNERDNILTGEEFIHFVYDNPDWERFLPALDRAGLRHPLDLRNIPRSIIQRIQEIKEKVETKIGLPPEEPNYYSHFVPAFFQAGLATFEDGGLGFSYPFSSQLDLTEPELTAAEAFDAVLDPDNMRHPYGSSTEATYKVIAAFRVMGVPHDKVVAVETQNYLTARFEKTDLDSSKIGKLGWERILSSDAAVAAMYYHNVAASEAQNGRVDSDQYAEALGIVEILTPKDPDIILTKAAGCWMRAEVEETFQEISRAIEMNPDNSETFLEIQSILTSDPDRSQEAIDFAGRIVKRYPKNAYPLTVLIQICLPVERKLRKEAVTLQRALPDSGYGEVLLSFAADLTKNDAEATHWSQEALKKNRNNPYALQQIAFNLYSQGRIDVAKSILQMSIDQAPNLPHSHALLSGIYLMQGEVEAAYVEAKREPLSFFGNSPADHLPLGNTALAAGDLDTALSSMIQYTRAFPTDPSGLMVLATVETCLGQLDEATQTCKEGLALETLPPLLKVVFHDQLASIGLLRPDLTEAENQLKEAEGLQLDFQELASIRFQILMARHQYEDALKAALKMTEQYPNFSTSWSSLASIRYLLNNQEKAKAAIDEALKKNGRDLRALSIKALIALEEGNSAGAAKIVDQMREFHSSFPEFHAQDALFSYLQGDRERALKEADRALRAFRHDPNALLVKGILNNDEGNVDEAEEIATKLDQFYPRDFSGPFLKAKIQFRQGHLEEAAKEARAAIDRFPDDSGRLRQLSFHLLLEEILKAQQSRTR